MIHFCCVFFHPAFFICVAFAIVVFKEFLLLLFACFQKITDFYRNSRSRCLFLSPRHSRSCASLYYMSRTERFLPPNIRTLLWLLFVKNNVKKIACETGDILFRMWDFFFVSHMKPVEIVFWLLAFTNTCTKSMCQPTIANWIVLNRIERVWSSRFFVLNRNFPATDAFRAACVCYVVSVACFASFVWGHRLLFCVSLFWKDKLCCV